jgi:plasmid stabilization system protein ParE
VRDLIFHPEADEDYRHAYRWYEERSARAAQRFETEVENILNRISNEPELFPKYDATNRFAVVRRFPYSVVYRPLDDCLYVIAVAHSSRSPGYWRDRE